MKPSTPCKAEDKIYICLFTCCVVRAVHLEVVVNLSVSSFIRCLKRFIARRGLPRRIVSDNGKTFKGAAKFIRRVMGHSEVIDYLSWSGSLMLKEPLGGEVCLKEWLAPPRSVFER